MFLPPEPRSKRMRTTSSHLPDRDASTGLLCDDTDAARRARFCPSRHLTVDDLLRLFDRIEYEGGIATLDEIRHALPDVARPVSGVLDLCDAGILHGDFDAPFDGDTRIWRLDR